MKKLITSLFLILGLLVIPTNVYADGQVLGETTEETCVETTVYGGGVGVVCGTKTHTPVDTGVEDLLGVLATSTLFTSGAYFVFSKKRASKAN